MALAIIELQYLHCKKQNVALTQ